MRVECLASPAAWQLAEGKGTWTGSGAEPIGDTGHGPKDKTGSTDAPCKPNGPSSRYGVVGDRVNLAGSCGVIPLMTIATIDRTVRVEEDEDRLARFVEADYGSLVAALGLVCGDRAAAEDAVQEALARAVVALRKGATIDSVPAWVRVVALNLLRNRWRSLVRERRARRRLEHGPSTSDSDRIEDALDLQSAIASLSQRQREAVALYYRLGLSVSETADAMKVSEGTVKTLLSRARTALAAAMNPEEVTRG
jgi:RNA polymerase sigma factor (sigma-70 family)